MTAIEILKQWPFRGQLYGSDFVAVEYAIEAMKQYAKQEREKAFNAATEMTGKNSKSDSLADHFQRKYKSFEEYKQQNPLT